MRVYEITYYIGSVVGKSDEFTAVLESVDFCFEANKGLIVLNTSYFDGALIS